MGKTIHPALCSGLPVAFLRAASGWHSVASDIDINLNDENEIKEYYASQTHSTFHEYNKSYDTVAGEFCSNNPVYMCVFAYNLSSWTGASALNILSRVFSLSYLGISSNSPDRMKWAHSTHLLTVLTRLPCLTCSVHVVYAPRSGVRTQPQAGYCRPPLAISRRLILSASGRTTVSSMKITHSSALS